MFDRWRYRRGRHLPGPRSGKNERPNRVTVQFDDVECSVGLRDRSFQAKQRWLDVHFQLVAHDASDGEQFDSVTEFFGVKHVGKFKRVDALSRKLVQPNLLTQSELRQQDQFLSRVGSVNVHRRISFGVTKSLSFSQHVFVLPLLAEHPAENKVARSVENGFDRNNPVPGHRTAHRRDDRDPASDGGFVRNADSGFASSRKHLVAMFSEQSFVRSYDMFAGGDGSQYGFASGRRAAHQFQDDVNFRIGNGDVPVSCQSISRDVDITSFGCVPDDDVSDFERAASSTTYGRTGSSQNSDDTGSNCSQTKNRQTQCRLRHL